MANAGRSSQRATGRRACRAWSVRVTRAPPSGRFAAATVPPCASAIARTIARPRPDPSWTASRPRLNGWKTASSSAGSKPVPVSSTSMVTVSPSAAAVMWTSRLEACAGARSRSGCRAPAGPGPVELHDRVRCLRLQGDAGSVGRRGERAPALLDQGHERHGRAMRRDLPAVPHAPARAGPRRRGRGGPPRRTRPRGRRGVRRASAAPASAESTSAFRIVSGVRSSWLASSTNRRSRSSASWSRSKVRFSVTASGRACRRSWAPAAGGSGRTPRWPPPRGACARPGEAPRRPGASRPATTGRGRRATRSRTATSAASSASWLSLSVAPTTTKTVSPAFSTGTTSRRDESSPAAGGRRTSGLVSARARRRRRAGPSPPPRCLDRPAGGRQHLGERLVRVDQAAGGGRRQRGIGLHALAAITWARDWRPVSTDARRSSRSAT